MLLPPEIRSRYQAAYDAFQLRAYPSATKDFGTLKAVIPDTRKANGLTRFVLNYLTWSGHRATRISSSGRVIDTPVRQPSGVSLMTKKYIPAQTRRGAADISSTIKGRSVMWEIKVGRDKPSEYQLREQSLERAAGGEYFFTHSVDEFFEHYDGLLLT